MEQVFPSQDLSFQIVHQQKYSRGELLLRSFFGIFYLAIPHLFLLALLGIISGFLTFISFWAILFTGKYPRPFFDFQLSMIRWFTRVTARLFHLSDGYPAFGISAQDERVIVDLPYPEKMSRGLLILRLFFGFLYVVIPHGFILFFRMIAVYVAVFISWWAVLFTGEYPKGLHDFVVNTLRWTTRIRLYMAFLSDKYPPFTGK